MDGFPLLQQSAVIALPQLQQTALMRRDDMRIVRTEGECVHCVNVKRLSADALGNVRNGALRGVTLHGDDIDAMLILAEQLGTIVGPRDRAAGVEGTKLCIHFEAKGCMQ